LTTNELARPHTASAGVNPSDWKKRQGLMDRELPQTMGHEAAGVVDELDSHAAPLTPSG
jgi:NADPH:quinone reductase-like Zn-dependent oxidoreductase